MRRKARIDAPGALHHIIISRIERKAVFKVSADGDNFIARLGRFITETETHQNLISVQSRLREIKCNMTI